MRALLNDLPLAMDMDEATTRETDWGDMHVAFETYRVDMDSAPFFVGLPDDHCQCPHWGYVFKGRYVVSYSDGTQETIEAGQTYYLKPGHTAVLEAGTELLEFSPPDLHAQTMEVAQRNFEAMMGGGE